MSTAKLVIVLTGVPGVGKSTVADTLAERLGGDHIDLSDLAEQMGFITGWDEQRRTAIADIDELRQHVTLISDASTRPVIVEGHFAADVVNAATEPLVFVLRRAPWRLKEELEVRGYGEEKVSENVEAELLDVCLVDALEVHDPERICEVDTTDRLPEDVVEEILSIIHGDTECSHGHIDWLGWAESKRLMEDG